MGRRRRTAHEILGAPKVREARETTFQAIHPLVVYRRSEVLRLMHISHHRLTEEVQAGRMRCVTEPRGKQLFLGEWLLAWLRSQAPAAIANGQPTQPG